MDTTFDSHGAKVRKDVLFVLCPAGSFRRPRALRRGKVSRIGPLSSTSRTVTCSVRRNSKGSSKRKEGRQRRGLEETNEASMKDSLGPTPGELHGFHGWREEDDEYWRKFRRREKAFRGPKIPDFDPENESYEPPKGRDGKPIRYPAAVKWDVSKGTFVPTTEEEEEEMRGPSKVMDPFRVEEAEKAEEYRPNLKRDVCNSDRSIELEPVLYRIGPTFEGDGGDEELLAGNGSNEEDKATCESVVDDDIGRWPGAGLRWDHQKVVAGTKRKPLGLAPGDWKVVHLGTSSAIPTQQRNVSSTAFVSIPPNALPSTEPNMVLVDAGENTETRLLDAMWCMSHGFRWIRAIVITHLHGDHIYGLPGLLRGIAEYCQYRRRAALESGTEAPIIRIYGPYGTRGFLRSSLFWTVPLGVNFSVSELVPRDNDFLHIGRYNVDGQRPKGTSFQEVDAKGNVKEIFDDDPRFYRRVPPPHPEEVRAEDVHADEDGVWRIWGNQNDESVGFEVVAAPLKHRLPCFGYVFRGSKRPRTAVSKPTVESVSNGTGPENGATITNEIEIDVAKARALGVYGSQFRVLRAGRSVTVRKSERTVAPEDVMVVKTAGGCISDDRMELPSEETGANDKAICGSRKVVVLGDTCDSHHIAGAAMGADVLIHEATFANALRTKAESALHSTAGMAGKFARSIRAKKLVLTHFSSRYENFVIDDMPDTEDASMDDEEGDLTSAKQLVAEAAYKCPNTKVVAANDFMEHYVRSDGSVETKDRPFNRYAIHQVYNSYWKSRDEEKDSGNDEEGDGANMEENGIADAAFENDLADVEDFVTAEK